MCVTLRACMRAHALEGFGASTRDHVRTRTREILKLNASRAYARARLREKGSEMKNEREPAAKRLARYRRKDTLLNALIAGDVTTGDGAHNDRYLMTLLLHRCFSLAEIKAIMAPLTNGDNEKRAAMGDRYWLLVRREILGHLTPKELQNSRTKKAADRPHVPIAKRIADMKSDT